MNGVLDRLDGAVSWPIYALAVLLLVLVCRPAIRWLLRALKLDEFVAHSLDGIKSYFGAKRAALVRDWLTAGLCYERLGQYHEALDCYEKAREYHLCGEICHRMDRPDIAGEWFLVAGESQRAAAMFEEGGELEKAAEIYEKEEDYLKAAELFRATERFSRAGAIYEERGHFVKAAKAFEEGGRFRKAAENYERHLSGIERLPDEYQTATQRATISRISLEAARLYQEVGDLDSAARILERNGQWLPAAELLEILGHYQRSAELYQRLGQSPKAARLFDRAGDRRNAAALEAESQLTEGDALAAAESFLRAGDHHRAAQLFESAGDYFGAAECYVLMEAHSLAGDALVRGGDLEQAVAYFERAGEYGRAGEIQARLGRFEQAATLFAHAGRHYEAAMAASDGGDEDAMMEHLQRVEPEDRHFNEALVTLADLFCRRGWGSLALKRLVPVLEGEPVRREDLEVWDALALTYETLGEYEKAIEVLQKIMVVQFNYNGVDKRCEHLQTMLREEQDRQSSIRQKSELDEAPPPQSDKELGGERYVI